MKTGRLLMVTLACSTLAQADFSYVSTRKSAQGTAAGAGEQVTKHYLKGQKMKMDSGRTATIFDFEAQTMTLIDTAAKTYKVTPFAELAKGAGASTMAKADVSAKVDVKETGQKKIINGLNCSEVVMSIAMEGGAAAAQGMKMQMEMDMWFSSDAPGASELRAFYQKNGERFPWSAMGGGANPGMAKAIADMQKAMTKQGGVPVLQITRMKSAGNEQMNANVASSRAAGGDEEAGRTAGGDGGAGAGADGRDGRRRRGDV